MREYDNKNGFELSKTYPFLGLAGIVISLSFLALDPKKIRARLRSNFRSIFDNVLNNSNEKDEVQLAINNLPDGGEASLAQWINDSMDANRRKIAKKQVRPHHIIVDVFAAALSVAGRTKDRNK